MARARSATRCKTCTVTTTSKLAIDKGQGRDIPFDQRHALLGAGNSAQGSAQLLQHAWRDIHAGIAVAGANDGQGDAARAHAHLQDAGRVRRARRVQQRVPDALLYVRWVAAGLVVDIGSVVERHGQCKLLPGQPCVWGSVGAALMSRTCHAYSRASGEPQSWDSLPLVSGL